MTVPKHAWLLVLVGLMPGLAHFTGRAASGQSFEEAAAHWAYRPVLRPAVPEVRGPVRGAVDAFLLERLEGVGLGFAPEVDRRTWLRRVTYDLHGLPPTPEEWAAYAADTAPGAAGRVLDRLLASPRYGERWGRHWLDVARYADTKDLVLLYGRDALRPFAYTYRDYVIRAFNEGLPFDEFIRDQVAADLCGEELPRWRLAALGFLTLGRLFDNNRHDQIDDQIDTVTRGVLGLTVSCARCHDHKYDAVTMADYYGLYGVFASTEVPVDLPLLEDPGTVPGGEAFEAALGKARGELAAHVDAEHGRWTRLLRGRLGAYLVRAATTAPDLNETAQFALSLTPDDFRPTLVARTRRFLAERVRPEDPVFGPWAELVAWLGEDHGGERRTGAAWVEARLAAPPAGWHPEIVAGLRGAAGRLEDRAGVAEVYGEILVGAALRLGVAVDGLPEGYAGGPDADGGGDPVGETVLEPLAAIVAGPEGPLWFPHRDTPHHMSRPEKDRYNGLVLALDKLAVQAAQRPPARAMIVRDLEEPVDPRIFVRGSPARPGERVDRGGFRLLNGGVPRVFEQGSGRLELAALLADPDNPLTARVWANRVWMHHFGEALVTSTTDFGTRSDGPTHPELLDWLARGFVEAGWDTRWLHRTILLSRAYAQAAEAEPAQALKAMETDPDNRLLWQWRRRRLDWEAMRDTLLSVSGALDTVIGGPPVDLAAADGSGRRTVYGLVDRQNLEGAYRVFDFAAPDQCAERRPRTTVPQQALFALNGRPVMEAARAVVAAGADVGTGWVEGGPGAAGRVEALFLRVLGRAPRPEEVAAVQAYLEAGGAGEAAGGAAGDWGPWEQVAQVLLVGNEAVFLE